MLKLFRLALVMMLLGGGVSMASNWAVSNSNFLAGDDAAGGTGSG